MEPKIVMWMPIFLTGCNYFSLLCHGLGRVREWGRHFHITLTNTSREKMDAIFILYVCIPLRCVCQHNTLHPHPVQETCLGVVVHSREPSADQDARSHGVAGWSGGGGNIHWNCIIEARRWETHFLRCFCSHKIFHRALKEISCVLRSVFSHLWFRRSLDKLSLRLYSNPWIF